MKLVGNRIIECDTEEELNVIASALDKDVESLDVPLDVGHLKFRTKKFFRINKFEFFVFVGRTKSRRERDCVV